MKRGKLTAMLALKLIAFLGLSMLAGCLGLENRGLQKTALASPDISHPISSIAIKEITGMPDAKAARFRKQLKADLASRGFTLVDQSQNAAYSLAGFTSAAPVAKGTTLVTIWEILDKKGRRAHRFIGEQTGPASPAGNPWAGVNTAMLNAVSASLARDYKAWATGRSASSHQPESARLNRTMFEKKSAKVTGPKPLVTGSIPAKPARHTISLVPLSGAPGDGNTALAVALKSALARSGYKIVPAGQKAAYSISGKVLLGLPKSGKQDLAIDWKVTDAKNRRIGVIRQRNKVKANALGQQWGETAGGAAKAAAIHIEKLLR